MRLRRVVIVLLVVLLLGALVVPAVGAKQDKMVPLRGHFEGVGPVFSGTFSHLGHFEGVVTGQEPTTAKWTAANGKDVVENETIDFVIDFLNPIEPGVFPYTQEIEITGGEGRFVCATGNGSITGTIDLNEDPFTYDGQLEGKISQPNKKRECPPDDDLPPRDDF